MSSTTESNGSKKQRTDDTHNLESENRQDTTMTPNDKRFADVDTSEEALYDSPPTPTTIEINDDDDVDMQDEATVVAGRPQVNIFKTRVTLTLQLKCRNNPCAATTQLLRAFMQTAKQHDEHFGLLPWYHKDASTKQLILTAESIPSSFSQIQAYSPRLNPDKKKLTQTLWALLYLQHLDSYIDTVKNIEVFLDEGDHTIWKKALDVEKEVDVGTLCFTTKNMDRELIVSDVSTAIGFTIGLAWKATHTGKKGPIPKEQKVSALQVVANAKEASSVLRKLSTLFGKTYSNFPCGRRIQFYLHWNLVYSVKAQSKIIKMLERQKSFDKLVKKSVSSNIKLLDWKAEPNHKTLCAILLGLKSKLYPSAPQFVLVDNHFGSNSGVVIQFMPHIENEAMMTVQNLIPYLCAKVGDYIELWW